MCHGPETPAPKNRETEKFNKKNIETWIFDIHKQNKRKTTTRAIIMKRAEKMTIENKTTEINLLIYLAI